MLVVNDDPSLVIYLWVEQLQMTSANGMTRTGVSMGESLLTRLDLPTLLLIFLNSIYLTRLLRPIVFVLVKVSPISKDGPNLKKRNNVLHKQLWQSATRTQRYFVRTVVIQVQSNVHKYIVHITFDVTYY